MLDAITGRERKAVADVMIYWGEHWMDKLSPAEVENLPSKRRKAVYEPRYQHGDIVLVVDDGVAVGWKQKKNRRLAVAGLLLAKAKAYWRPAQRERDLEERIEDSMTVEKMIQDMEWTHKKQGLPFTKKMENKTRRELQEQNEQRRPLRFRCRYKIDVSQLTTQQVEVLTEPGGSVELTCQEFKALVIDKDG